MFPPTKRLPSLRLVTGTPKKEIWVFPLKSWRLKEGLWRISMRLIRVAIKVNGRRLIREDEAEEEVVNDFQRVLSKIVDWRPNINGLPFLVLDNEEARALENPFWRKRSLQLFLICVGIRLWV
ncbi:hypothetical protein CK203_000426 [Vitis vinifera]|uniref:Uncharacterized protein n=1 Tax=Vitis vinifera TaxID=29760 RepID=A0A438KQ43_VITVI|nr:hypothetical protein CK203_000426 [Vitis vinifera]